MRERAREGEKEGERGVDKVGFPLFQRKRFHTQFAYCACCLCAAVIVHEPWERSREGEVQRGRLEVLRIKYANEHILFAVHYYV